MLLGFGVNGGGVEQIEQIPLPGQDAAGSGNGPRWPGGVLPGQADLLDLLDPTTADPEPQEHT